MARTVEQISKELESIYSPQRQLIQQQQAQIPGQYQAQLSALDQAKINAFKDITTAANRRGMYFSGVPVSEQATYTGTKYLPAVANLKQSQLTQQNALQAALNELTGKQMSQAQGLYSAELQAEQEAAAKRYAAELEAQQKELDRQAKIYEAQIKAQAKASTGGSTGSAKQTTQNIMTSLSQDIAQMFSGYNPSKNKFYTEKSVLPQLTSLYPELTPKQIRDAVYGYRKNVFGE